MEGMKAVKESYMRNKEKKTYLKVFITFLSLILILNNCVLSLTHYLQILGCVMDTICAPSYKYLYGKF